MDAMNIQRTVREFALESPSARQTLESLGIDTCCGGRKALVDAVRDAGLDMEAVQAQLINAVAKVGTESEDTPKRDWRETSLAELADHIEETHHAFLREVLPRVSDRLTKVMKAHGAHHGEMLRDVEAVFFGLREEIEAHLLKEEQILFPYVREMSAALDAGKPLPPMHCGSVANPIHQMEHEHENAGAALSFMRKRTSDYRLPDDACPTFAGLYEDLQALEADLHEHIFLENNILFPKAVGIEERSRGCANGEGGQL
jgi:regulator of cell morphogenesis and NO signaling